MDLRYLDASRVTLDASAPQLVEPGHCLWCHRPLTGKAKKYCSLKMFDQEKYRWWTQSPCYIAFFNYFYTRPAYQRATFIRDSFTCQSCGLHPMRQDKPWLPDLRQLHCDHIIPVSKGGGNGLDNTQTLCRKCNLAKGAKVEGEEEGIPSYKLPRDGYPPGECPKCKNPTFLLLPWEVPAGYDPKMRKVSCRRCEVVYFMAPIKYNRRARRNETHKSGYQDDRDASRARLCA